MNYSFVGSVNTRTQKRLFPSCVNTRIAPLHIPSVRPSLNKKLEFQKKMHLALLFYLAGSALGSGIWK